MVPAAPARLSTMTGWPSASPSAGATVRAVMSTFPLGGNGTTMCTGRAGNSWALIRELAARAAMAPRSRLISICAQECALLHRYGAVDADELVSFGTAHEPEKARYGRRRRRQGHEEDFASHAVAPLRDIVDVRCNSVDAYGAQPASAQLHGHRRGDADRTASGRQRPLHARWAQHRDRSRFTHAPEAPDVSPCDLSVQVPTRQGVRRDCQVRATK